MESINKPDLQFISNQEARHKNYMVGFRKKYDNGRHY